MTNKIKTEYGEMILDTKEKARTKTFEDVKLEQELKKQVKEQKSRIERGVKEEFSEYWDAYGTQGYSIDNFDLRFNPFHAWIFVKVSRMTTPNKCLDLDKMASDYSNEKIENLEQFIHEFSENIPYKDLLRGDLSKYVETSMEMDNGLKALGLHASSRGNAKKEIRDYLETMNVVLFSAGYFRSENGQ